MFDSDPKDDIIDRAIATVLTEAPGWAEKKERLRRLLKNPEGILGPPEEKTGEIADLCARAWAELANVYRLTGELGASEDALVRAAACLKEGTGNFLILGQLFESNAFLWRDLGHFSEALDLLGSACRLYLEIGETHRAGRAFISKGMIHRVYDDSPREAIPLFREGLGLIDPQRDPWLAACGRFNLLATLEQCGEYREAGRLLFKSGLREAVGDPLSLARLGWLEGRIQAGLGKLWRAEQLLGEARDVFLEHGYKYDADLVGLELVSVLIRQEKYAAVWELLPA